MRGLVLIPEKGGGGGGTEEEDEVHKEDMGEESSFKT